MHTVRDRTRLTLLLVICCVVAGSVLISTPSAADLGPDELITGIETARFLEVVFGVASRDVFAGYRAPVYDLRGRDGFGACNVQITVEASCEDAVANMRGRDASVAVSHLVGARPEPLAVVGDEMRCPISEPDTSSGIVLRRRNVVVAVTFRGGRQAAHRLLQTIDETLVQRDDICPKGPVVPIPNVEITGPARVALNLDPKVLSTGQVHYRSTDAMLLRTEYQSVLHLAGSVHLDSRELGKREVSLRFATSRNVVFTRTHAFEVVPPEQLQTEDSVTPWPRWPGERLYFVRDPQQDWTVVPNAEKEWFNLDHGTFSRIDPPQSWQQRALNDLTRALKPRWLPVLEMLEVRKNIGTPAQRKVYYAAFRTRGCGVICMGVVGEQVLVYIEQPTPLPEGQEEVWVEDVVAPDWLGEATDESGETVWPRLQVMTRTLDRYRGYRAAGPFEPVRILLVDVRFPARTNLRFPGYR